MGGNGTLGRGKKGIERRREGGRCTGGSNNSWKLQGKRKREKEKGKGKTNVVGFPEGFRDGKGMEEVL